jgi:hypothetical protein
MICRKDWARSRVGRTPTARPLLGNRHAVAPVPILAEIRSAVSPRTQV